MPTFSQVGSGQYIYGDISYVEASVNAMIYNHIYKIWSAGTAYKAVDLALAFGVSFDDVSWNEKECVWYGYTNQEHIDGAREHYSICLRNKKHIESCSENQYQFRVENRKVFRDQKLFNRI